MVVGEVLILSNGEEEVLTPDSGEMVVTVP